MSHLQPVPPRSSPGRTFVSQDLADCTHVFIRVDAVHPPFTQPYQVSNRVLRRTRKTVTVDRKGSTEAVSIDRIILVYILEPDTTAVLAATTTDESKACTRRVRFSLPSRS
ncbi:hypothetical protein E2C01_027967 [Portunus trituberculatus]|uniref:Uncharacterized protein n=2 Tax=Portunus trituberculatus TaxID=210409 RepID=A0A5B7EQC5_PORTR|nr:hypothetical protein [Portunus trituberculatus]